MITSVPPAVGFTNPLPANVPDRVAALAVFGNPTAKVGLPLTSSPLYGARAIDLCNAGDLVLRRRQRPRPPRLRPVRADQPGRRLRRRLL